jgi:hypothetical protein
VPCPWVLKKLPAVPIVLAMPRVPMAAVPKPTVLLPALVAAGVAVL